LHRVLVKQQILAFVLGEPTQNAKHFKTSCTNLPILKIAPRHANCFDSLLQGLTSSFEAVAQPGRGLLGTSPGLTLQTRLMRKLVLHQLRKLVLTESVSSKVSSKESFHLFLFEGCRFKTEECPYKRRQVAYLACLAGVLCEKTLLREVQPTQLGAQRHQEVLWLS
jgi:hypothetical protein